MAGAVFSDVEGTLVDGSLPRMSLALGRRLGICAPWEMAQVQLRAAGMRLLPAERRRQAQIAMIVRAMAGHTTAETERLAAALVTEATGRLKAAPLERLREHQPPGPPLVLVSPGMHPPILRLCAPPGRRARATLPIPHDLPSTT